MGQTQVVEFEHELADREGRVVVQVSAEFYARIGPRDDVDDYDEVGDVTATLDGEDVTRLLTIADIEAISARVPAVARGTERIPPRRIEGAAQCAACGRRPADAAYLGCCSAQCEAAYYSPDVRAIGGAA